MASAVRAIECIGANRCTQWCRALSPGRKGTVTEHNEDNTVARIQGVGVEYVVVNVVDADSDVTCMVFAHSGPACVIELQDATWTEAMAYVVNEVAGQLQAETMIPQATVTIN